MHAQWQPYEHGIPLDVHVWWVHAGSIMLPPWCACGGGAKCTLLTVVPRGFACGPYVLINKLGYYDLHVGWVQGDIIVLLPLVRICRRCSMPYRNHGQAVGINASLMQCCGHAARPRCARVTHHV
jgi:hypothetical protein